MTTEPFADEVIVASPAIKMNNGVIVRMCLEGDVELTGAHKKYVAHDAVAAKSASRVDLWDAKNELCQQSGNRYYGDGGTIHDTGHLHVETHNGKVVAVWFRCQLLPFEQVDVDSHRATEMLQGAISFPPPELRGVELKDTTK